MNTLHINHNDDYMHVPPAKEPAGVSHSTTKFALDSETARIAAATPAAPPPPNTALITRLDQTSAYKEFQWDARSAHAAALFADGAIQLPVISVMCSATIRELCSWRVHPTFRRRVNELVARASEDIVDLILLSKVGRMRRALQIADSYATVREERAISASPELYEKDEEAPHVMFDPDLAQAPGGRTGIVKKVIKVLGSGANAERVVDFQTDDAGVAAELAAMQYVAREQGQWTEKSESTILQKAYIGIDIDLM